MITVNEWHTATIQKLLSFMSGKKFLVEYYPTEHDPEKSKEIVQQVHFENYETNEIEKLKNKTNIGIADEKDNIIMYWNGEFVSAGETLIIHKGRGPKKLQKGDHFVDANNDEVEVITRRYCESYQKVKYFGKRLRDGLITIWDEDCVEEVLIDY